VKDTEPASPMVGPAISARFQEAARLSLRDWKTRITPPPYPRLIMRYSKYRAEEFQGCRFLKRQRSLLPQQIRHLHAALCSQRQNALG